MKGVTMLEDRLFSICSHAAQDPYNSCHLDKTFSFPLIRRLRTGIGTNIYTTLFHLGERANSDHVSLS